jgi:hypothetical protein
LAGANHNLDQVADDESRRTGDGIVLPGRLLRRVINDLDFVALVGFDFCKQPFDRHAARTRRNGYKGFDLYFRHSPPSRSALLSVPSSGHMPSMRIEPLTTAAGRKEFVLWLGYTPSRPAENERHDHPNTDAKTRDRIIRAKAKSPPRATPV